MSSALSMEEAQSRNVVPGVQRLAKAFGLIEPGGTFEGSARGRGQANARSGAQTGWGHARWGTLAGGTPAGAPGWLGPPAGAPGLF